MAFATLSWMSVYPVGWRAHHLLGGEIAGGADPVLDDELLPEPLGQPLSHQAGSEIATTAGRKADDKTQPAATDSFPPRRCATTADSTAAPAGQMQKISAGKFHLNLPHVTRSPRQLTVILGRPPNMEHNASPVGSAQANAPEVFSVEPEDFPAAKHCVRGAVLTASRNAQSPRGSIIAKGSNERSSRKQRKVPADLRAGRSGRRRAELQPRRDTAVMI